MKKITLLWCAVLLCCTFQISAQTTLEAARGILSNDTYGDGVQTWGDNVTLQAFKIDGSPGRVKYDSQFRDKGFGIEGARWDQIDYYQDYQGQRVDASEKMVINFNGPVTNVVLRVGMMGANEGHPQGETGKWTGYDANGNEIASGRLGADDSALGKEVKYNTNSYGLYPFNLESSVPLYRVDIEATGFGYGTGSPNYRNYDNESGNRENNSDFNIAAITYTRPDADPVNSAPIANNDAPGAVREDIGPTAFSYDVFLANDTDVDEDELEIVSFDFSNFPGTIEDKRAERIIEFRTEVNFNGEITIPYTITDGTTTDSAVITLTISEVPDELDFGTDGPFVTNENEPLTIPIGGLLANDVANPYLGSPVEITFDTAGNAINGSISVQGENLVFTPTANFSGTASFTYAVIVLNDGFGPPRPVNVGTSPPITINVEEASGSGNTAPVANDDTPGSIREDIGPTAFSYDVFLANDADADGDELEIVSFDFSNFPGTIEDKRAERIIEFRTEVNFNGEITVPYTITDGTTTDSAVITLTIFEVPDELDFGTDGPFETTVNEPVTIPIGNLLSNDTANPYLGSPVEITFDTVGNAVNGTIVAEGENIIFTPTTSFSGTASFTYAVIVLNDGFGPPRPVNVGTSDPIIINVNGDIPQAPSINQKAILVSKANEDLTLQVNTKSNRTSAIVEECDENGQVWTISDRGNGFHKISNDYAGKALEAWQRTPANGDDVTIYSDNNFDWQQWEIIDGGNGYYKVKGKYNQRFMTLSNGNAVMLNENGGDDQLWKFLDPAGVDCSQDPDNNSPVAEGDGAVSGDPDFTLVLGETLIIPFERLLANDTDPDGDNLTIIAVERQRGGDVEIIGETIAFTGTGAFPGALFTYTVSDGKGGTDTAGVFLNVVDAQEEPTLEAVDDGPFEVREDIGPTAFSYDVFLQNDVGENLEIVEFDFSDFPGTIEAIAADREILFTTALDFAGEITIPYTISDGTATDLAIITINILDVQDSVTVGQDGPFETDQGEAVTIAISDLLANDSASSFTGIIEFESAENAVNGAVNVDGESVVFVPNSGFTGQASFTYTIITRGGAFGGTITARRTSSPVTINVVGEGSGAPLGEIVLQAKNISVNATSDAQQWGTCTAISAFGADGTPAPVQLSRGRIGVKGDRYDSQLDYNPFSNTSERIEIDFNRPVVEVSFTLGNLETGEWQGADETGIWKLFDANGNEVAQGIIAPGTGTPVGNSVYKFTTGTSEAAVQLVLEATPYGSGTGAERTNNNSDYSLVNVGFNPLEAGCETTNATSRSVLVAPKVYPTSVNRIMNVMVDQENQWADQKLQAVYFYNTGGVLVKKDLLQGTTFGACDVNALDSGLFIVRVVTTHGSYSYKIIKR